MFEITVEDHIDAAHYLRNYGGKCENLHGHRFKIAATIKANELNEAGLAYDFRQLKNMLNKVLDTLDHTCLNENKLFLNVNPSSENLAKGVFDSLKKELPIIAQLVRVEVWESPDSRACYYPG